jgi:mannose-6-phosphate isomerase-like protein (cupin superfamily)
MIERIEIAGVVLAIILRSGFRERGVHFFTPGEFSQQLGYMCHPAGHVIEAHVHNPVHRAVNFTREVLFLRRGRLRVDFYTDNGNYLESRELRTGDVILLAAGGHGFQALEEVEIIEVKQGPYVGDSDKTRIKNVSASELRIERTAKAMVNERS